MANEDARSAAHADLTGVVDAVAAACPSQPEKLEQLAAHVATAHMVVDLLFDGEEAAAARAAADQAAAAAAAAAAKAAAL
ncbi:MAG TPA: hypothetical protein VN738_11340 [Acidothermaceae bacterium]|nr:hypothetical protein [Acidothermaceae bacterium]